MRRWTRPVGFAGTSVVIEGTGLRARAIVDFLFRHVPAEPAASPAAIFSVHSRRAGRTLTVCRDTRECYAGPSATDAARVLLEAVSVSLAEGCTGGLLLHAAAVSRAGRVVLLPGPTGVGKTTLTTRLVANGFRYLTDELSYVADRTLAVEAFARPLNVKPSGLALLPDPAGPDGEWPCLSDEAATLVQPPLERVASPAGPVTLAAIVFPRRQPSVTPRLVPLGRAQTGLRLMACLLNARNLPDHGFPAVAALVRRVSSCEVLYSEREQVEPFLRRLLSQARPR
jgi:hypothetical protein